MYAKLFSLLQSLIQIDSTNPPGNEQAIIQQFINRNEATGLPYQVMTVDNNRSNFSVRINGSNTDKGKLLLNGHTDTVKLVARNGNIIHLMRI